MNKKVLSLVLTLSCLVLAVAQEPPGCDDNTPQKKHTPKSQISGKLRRQSAMDLQTMPLIASPVFMPQTSPTGSAITASGGFLYVVVGQRLYKVNEKTLRTVQTSLLGKLGGDEVVPQKASKKRKKKPVEEQ